MRAIGILCAMILGAGAASAQSMRLAPASPQPDEAALKPGLAAIYAYPPDVKWLSDAEKWLKSLGRPGKPLRGLSYRDTALGEKALTSDQATKVAAEITGFVRFDRAGPAKLEFYSNDGIQATIGGVELPKHDGRHRCESDGYYDVVVPEPGWYPVKIVWFQRLSTSCLMMKTDAAEGGMGWAPDEMFAYLP